MNDDDTATGRIPPEEGPPVEPVDDDAGVDDDEFPDEDSPLDLMESEP